MYSISRVGFECNIHTYYFRYSFIIPDWHSGLFWPVWYVYHGVYQYDFEYFVNDVLVLPWIHDTTFEGPVW